MDEKTRQYNREYKRTQRLSPEFRAKEHEWLKRRRREITIAVRKRRAALREACKALRAKGLTQREIAAMLGVSVPTVRHDLYDRPWPAKKN